jgi:hypothetical protein
MIAFILFVFKKTKTEKKMATEDYMCYCPICGKKRSIYFFEIIALPTRYFDENWTDVCGDCYAVKERRYDEVMAYWARHRNCCGPKVSFSEHERWHHNYLRENPDYFGDENRIVRPKRQKL